MGIDNLALPRMNKYHVLEHIISMGLFQISVAIGTHTAAGNRTVLAFIKNKTSSIQLHVPFYIPFHFPLHVPLHVPFYIPFHFPLHVPISMFHCSSDFIYLFLHIWENILIKLGNKC